MFHSTTTGATLGREPEPPAVARSPKVAQDGNIRSGELLPVATRVTGPRYRSHTPLAPLLKTALSVPRAPSSSAPQLLLPCSSLATSSARGAADVILEQSRGTTLCAEASNPPIDTLLPPARHRLDPVPPHGALHHLQRTPDPRDPLTPHSGAGSPAHAPTPGLFLITVPSPTFPSVELKPAISQAHILSPCHPVN